MNMPALIIGGVIAWFVIHRFAKRKRSFITAYAIFLATFPAYYWVFALSQGYTYAFIEEVMWGVVFIGCAVVAYRLNNKLALLVLATGYIGHGIYDVLHAIYATPHVAPVWWPEFCGMVDIAIGLYLLYRYKKWEK